MKQVNHEQLGSIIKKYYKAKQSLFIQGTYGIGKTYKVREDRKSVV